MIAEFGGFPWHNPTSRQHLQTARTWPWTTHRTIIETWRKARMHNWDQKSTVILAGFCRALKMTSKRRLLSRYYRIFIAHFINLASAAGSACILLKSCQPIPDQPNQFSRLIIALFCEEKCCKNEPWFFSRGSYISDVRQDNWLKVSWKCDEFCKAFLGKSDGLLSRWECLSTPTKRRGFWSEIVELRLSRPDAQKAQWKYSNTDLRGTYFIPFWEPDQKR